MNYALILSFISLGLAIWAAVLWYSASKVSSPPSWIDEDKPEEANPDNLNFDLILGLLAANRKSSAMNRSAALVTGASVVVGAISTVLGALHT